MCTPNSHLPALVRLNQAEKDNEAFYLDATDFKYSPRDLQLFVFEFEAPTLSCKVPLIQEEKSCRGEKIEENQKKYGIHKRGSVVEAYSRKALQLLVSKKPTLVAVSWSKAPLTKKNCKATS